MGKQYEELGITDAFMFAKVMSNKEICKPVLEQILNIKIRDIEYLDYEETIQIAPGSKSIRLDIYVEDDKIILKKYAPKCKRQIMRSYRRGHDIIRT